MKTLNEPKINNLSFEKESEKKDFHSCPSASHPCTSRTETLLPPHGHEAQLT